MLLGHNDGANNHSTNSVRSSGPSVVGRALVDRKLSKAHPSAKGGHGGLLGLHRLQRGDRGGHSNVVGRAAAGEVVDRARQALENGPHRLGTGQPLGQLVGNVSSVEICARVKQGGG